MLSYFHYLPLVAITFLGACASRTGAGKESATAVPAGTAKSPVATRDSIIAHHPALLADPAAGLPVPYATRSATKRSKDIGWPAGTFPQSPAGFEVKPFMTGLDHPRWLHEGSNGEYFVSLAKTRGRSPNEIWMLRDADGDGVAESKTLFASGLNKPFGMLILNGYFYVANTDAVLRWPYKTGQTTLAGPGTKILDLPAGGYNNHWTRNLTAHPNGSKIYVSVGSASNVGEHGMEEEKRRACILEINPDGTGETVYASGLRNPVGMDWQPGTGKLFTAVNERDELGDELVPDYLTSVRRNAFYGWPYSYFGQIEDPRRRGERPDLVKMALKPDMPLGSHTASLGLAFYRGSTFPEHYHNGAFVGQHGSWNRSNFSGYKVVFVPFKNGEPQPAEDFLTGFIANASENETYGRPVGTFVTRKGHLLVTDDTGGVIWSVVKK